MEILYASLAMFGYVFTKAFQQRNVAFDHYWPVIPTSWIMFAMEAYIVVTIASRGWDILFVGAVGTSAGLGALGAMVLHKHLFRGDKRCDTTES